MQPIQITQETSLKELRKFLKERKKINAKDFGIAVLMNSIEEINHEPWQVIVAVTKTDIVLISTNKYNQGQRYQTDPNRAKFQSTISFETFKKALVCEQLTKKAA